MILRIINQRSMGTVIGTDSGGSAGAGSRRPALMPDTNPVVTGSRRGPSDLRGGAGVAGLVQVGGSGVILQLA